VFAREIGEKGDARGGQAASARYRGAGSAARAAKGRGGALRQGRGIGIADLGKKGEQFPWQAGPGWQRLAERRARRWAVLRVRAMRRARSRAEAVASGPGRKEKKVRRAAVVRAGVGGRAGRVSWPKWPAGSSWALGGFWVGLRIGSGRAGSG